MAESVNLPHLLMTWIILGCLAVVAGCNSSPELVQVKGVVYMDGEPVKHAGFVRIEPANGRAATGEIDPTDGSFTMTSMTENDGCLVGEHPVAVMITVNIGDEHFSLIDKKYSNASRSGLMANLSENASGLKIELFGGIKDPPRR